MWNVMFEVAENHLTGRVTVICDCKTYPIPVVRERLGIVFRIESQIENLIRRVGTERGEMAFVDVRFLNREQHPLRVGLANAFFQYRFQAGVVVEQFEHRQALLLDGRRPASGSERRLILPFEEMPEQDFEATLQLAAFAGAHAFDFLHEMFQIQFGDFSGTDQCGLLLCPGMEVLVM